MTIKEYFELHPAGSMLTAGAIMLIAGFAIAFAQGSCGKKHEDNAIIAGAQADTHAAELADLRSQLEGKSKEIESLKTQGLAFKAKYEAAKAKIPLPPLPPPVNESDLADGLKKLGLHNDVEVRIAVPSVLNMTDAQTVWTLGEQANRVPALESTLFACDATVNAQEATVKAQTEALDTSARALAQSVAEANARATQAQELGKALKVDKAKGWQKYGLAAAAVVVTLLVKK